RLTTVRPSVAASASPTRAYTWSSSPATAKPLGCGLAALATAERVTDPVSGSAIAAEVSGRSRSGGTSRGRLSGLAEYRSLPLRNHLQPLVPTTATATRPTASRRNRGRE